MFEEGTTPALENLDLLHLADDFEKQGNHEAVNQVFVLVLSTVQAVDLVTWAEEFKKSGDFRVALDLCDLVEDIVDSSGDEFEDLGNARLLADEIEQAMGLKHEELEVGELEVMC